MDQKLSRCLTITLILFVAVSIALTVSRFIESIHNNQYYEQQIEVMEQIKHTKDRLEQKLKEIS